LEINGVKLRNRFVMPGMQRGLGAGGMPAQALIEHFRRATEGGIGLVISESTAINHPSATRQTPALWMSAATLPGWQAVVETVHSNGSAFLQQLWHEGARRRDGGTGPYASIPTISPSGLAFGGRPNGRAATGAELTEILDGYVDAALLAQATGADGVEIHGAHGYLLDQFLWSVTNQRDDEFGGPDLAHRMRYPSEVVRAVRAACGPGFVISFRLSQWKEQDFSGKIAETPDDVAVLVAGLQEAGVDLLNVSTRRFRTPEWPQVNDWNFAGWVKSYADVPVITIGSVGLDLDMMSGILADRDPQPRIAEDLAELAQRFERGEFDLVAVGRGLLGDYEWVNKVEQGRYDDILPFRRAQLPVPGWDVHVFDEPAQDKG
jgi:2,4-dienoyl-CoA reductase-like NADH-dependent reductase (Old Yellow Enzyme family)